MNRWPLLAFALLVVGCRDKSTDLMPLKVKNEWQYLVRPGLQKYTDTLKVTREISVANVQGYELAGQMGVCRMAWKNGKLLTNEMANARFVPPLPLYSYRKKEPWTGWVYSLNKKEPARGEVTYEPQKLEVSGRKISTIRSTASLKIMNRQVELTTWFEAGVGIVQQEQRTNNELDVSIQLIRGL